MRYFFLCVALLFCTIRLCAQISIQQQWQDLSKPANGKVAAFAELLETGDTLSLNAHAHAPMQSVYKFPIAMAVLHAVDNGKLTLDQKIHVTKADYIPKSGHSPLRDAYPAGNVDVGLRELLRYNVAESDGSACDVLLRVLGGTGHVNDYVHDIGVKEIAIATTEQVQVSQELAQYQNWSTAAGLVQLLKIFYTGHVLTTGSRQLLLDLMTHSTPGAHRIKGLLPAGTVVAHKTGTSGTSKGLTRATNDIGIIMLPNGQHLLLAVLVSDSKADGNTREAVIAQLAKAAYDHFTALH